jgi:hypothetical protein
MKKILSLAAIAVFGAIVPGCGYSSSSMLAPDQHTIHIKPFANKVSVTKEVTDKRSSYFSYRPGLENQITMAVVNNFIFDRHLAIEKEDKADLILTGELVDMRQFPLSYSGSDDIQEFRIEINVDLELYDTHTKKVVWKEKRFMGQTSYSVTGQSMKSEAQALQDAVTDLSQRVVERTVENW